MAIYKLCSTCGKKVETGKECDCKKKIRYHDNKIYDKEVRDERSRKFYTSRTWRRCKENILASDEIDVYLYMKEGIIKAADTVHHIIPLRDNWSKRLQKDNLMSLSAGTHSMIERMYKKDKEKMIKDLQQMVKEFREKSEWKSIEKG